MTENSKILVVDDDDAHRTMLRTLVGGWGYDIEEADDGAVAVSKVQEDTYDLILMDVRMVRVSGLEALEKMENRLKESIAAQRGPQGDRGPRCQNAD